MSAALRITVLILPVLLSLSVIPLRAQATGSVRGTVTYSGSGEPIASAFVEVYDANKAFVTTATTDAAGAYLFTTLQPGTYYLKVIAAGYVTELFDGVPCVAADCASPQPSDCGGFSCIGTTGTPLPVTAGATLTANVALERGGTIAGSVRRASDDTTIAGVLVALYSSATSPIATIASSPDGSFSFSYLPPGTYYARTLTSALQDSAVLDYLDEVYGGPACPRIAGSSCRLNQGTPISVGGELTTTTINFLLDPAGRITGRASLASDGSPLRFLRIAVFSGATEVASTVTDGAGNYAIAGLSTGTYHVRTTAAADSPLIDEWYGGACVACPGTRPDAIAASTGATSAGVDFSLSNVSATITGSLTMATLPFTGSVYVPSVLIYNAEGALVKTVVMGTIGSAAPAVAAGGTLTWTARGLPTGTYYVRTSSSAQPSTQTGHVGGGAGGFWVDELFDNIPCASADCAPTRGMPISITGPVTKSEVNIALGVGAQISGAIPPGRFANAATRLEIYDARGVLLPGRITPNALAPTYFANGLPAGTYYVKLLRELTGVFPETLYRGLRCSGCAVTLGTPVAVASREVRSGVDFVALPARAIRGTVRSSASAPLSTVTVEAYTASGALAGSAVSVADGSYTIAALNPGTYYLRTVNQRGFVDQMHGGEVCANCDARFGPPVVVPASADTSGIDFSLAPGAMLSGAVTTTIGVPLTGVPLWVYRNSAVPELIAFPRTGVLGRYEVTLPEGRYVANTAPFSGYQQQVFDGISCFPTGCNVSSGTPIVVGATPVSSVNFQLAVCTPPVITPERLATTAVGVPYRQTLAVTGGVPSQLVLSAGVFPYGLQIQSGTTVIEGIPTEAGAFTFTLTAVDAAGCGGSRSYTLDIPACTFNSPAELAVSAAGESHLYGQSCMDPDWSVSTNVSWIVAQRTSSVRSTPSGIVEIPQVAVTIQANPSPLSRTGLLIIGSRVTRVYQAGTASAAPFGFLDTPRDGAIVSGSIAISGWALDDLSVSRVRIFRDAAVGEAPGAQIYVGDATFVPGARPDVEATYPSMPNATRAGWGYLLLTNMLPSHGEGTFRIRAVAEDTDGKQTLLGVRTIVAVNNTSTAPFGAIDTPAQGATTAGGNYINWGWALTPLPNLIPVDGSTILVYIDSLPVGTLDEYNLFRPDVSGLFPGLNNSAGPVGYRTIDTTALTEGVHTIAWSVADDGGQVRGIGSRFFTVQNSAWTASVSSALDQRTDARTPVPPRVPGIDIQRRAASLTSLPLDAERARTVRVGVLERIELDIRAADPVCPTTYEGYEVVRGELRELPVGASFDPDGIFHWQPGAGFRGTYRLLFVRTSCGGIRERIPVTVKVASDPR